MLAVDPSFQPRPILRQCVACRKPQERSHLIRVVLDRIGKQMRIGFPGERFPVASGRSAYVCRDERCLKIALKGKKLQKALKSSIPDDILECLNDLMKG